MYLELFVFWDSLIYCIWRGSIIAWNLISLSVSVLPFVEIIGQLLLLGSHVDVDQFTLSFMCG